MDALRRQGFSPLPVRWGQHEAERDGYVDFIGNFHCNVRLDNHGVGVLLKDLVTIETVNPIRPDVDAVIRAFGPCLVRNVADDPARRLYLFRSTYAGANQLVYSRAAHLAVRRRGLLVLSGADETGLAYEWESDVLQAQADQLSIFESHDAQRLELALEPLPYFANKAVA